MSRCPGPPDDAPTRSSIRRRSGAISTGYNSGSSDRSSSTRKDPGLAICVEDADTANGPPTVILVSKAESSESRSASLLPHAVYVRSKPRDVRTALNPESFAHNGLMLHVNGMKGTPTPPEYTPVARAFSEVPLTPRPTQPARDESAISFGSYGSSASTTYRPALSTNSSLGRLSSNFGQLTTGSKLTSKFPISRTVKKLAIETPQDASGLGIERIGRWTVHKCVIFLSILTLFCYGTAGLVYAISTWFKTWEQAEVMYVADYDVLVLITLSSAIVLLTFVIGITGTILNSRPILAVYTLLLWPVLISILAIGYTAYKRYAFSLDRKLNLAWSQWYTPTGRFNIQDTLRCCGYSSPLHEATSSPRCYTRSSLPGCKGKLFRFEKTNLQRIWTAAFAVVPLHILNIFVSLLCANHVTHTFGKGIMPRQYRLSGADVQADAEKIFGTLGQIGAVVRPTLARSTGSATFREDKVDLRRTLAMDSVPASLRPGYTPGPPSRFFSRKLE